MNTEQCLYLLPLILIVATIAVLHVEDHEDIFSADNHDNHFEDTADQFKDHDDDLEAGLCEILQKLEPWADSILSGAGRGPTGSGEGNKKIFLEMIMRTLTDDLPVRK